MSDEKSGFELSNLLLLTITISTYYCCLSSESLISNLIGINYEKKSYINDMNGIRRIFEIPEKHCGFMGFEFDQCSMASLADIKSTIKYLSY